MLEVVKGMFWKGRTITLLTALVEKKLGLEVVKWMFWGGRTITLLTALVGKKLVLEVVKGMFWGREDNHVVDSLDKEEAGCWLQTGRLGRDKEEGVDGDG